MRSRSRTCLTTSPPATRTARIFCLSIRSRTAWKPPSRSTSRSRAAIRSARTVIRESRRFSFSRSRGSNAANDLKPVVVKWFVSGRNAKDIVKWYGEKFNRGTRFVAYGLWQWEPRKQTFELMVSQTRRDRDPVARMRLRLADQRRETDETDEKSTATRRSKPSTRARVPVYRKLGPFQTKRLREIMHNVLAALDRRVVEDDLPCRPSETRRSDRAMRRRSRRSIFRPRTRPSRNTRCFAARLTGGLIFEEFFWLSFAMQLIRGERQKEPKGTVIEITRPDKRAAKNAASISTHRRSEKGDRRDLCRPAKRCIR